MIHMRMIRTNHINNRVTIIRPKNGSGDALDLKDRPTVSMIYHDGILQRVDGYEDTDGWSVKVFESKNPITSTDATMYHQDKPWFAQPAYGYHNVLVTTKDATPGMQENERWANLLVATQDRMRWLYDQVKVGYVIAFADMASKDIAEPHIQLVTLPTIPPIIKTEVEANRDLRNSTGACTMCQIIDKETDGKRQVLRSNSFVAICPWPPSSSYEFWIIPKKHSISFLRLTQVDLNDLAMLLRSTLGGLSETLPGVSFSIVFHLSSEKKRSARLHWHIEVYPDTRGPVGMGRGFGVSLCDISPEDAAKALSVASRKEWVNAVGVDL